MAAKSGLLTRTQYIKHRKIRGEQKRKRTLIRTLCLLAWLAFLSTFILVDNLEAYMYHRAVHFQWTPEPDFRELFYIHDAHVTHPAWLFIKSGHFIGFAILDVLMFNLIRNKRTSVLLSVLLAILSEIVQLYFSRDGRMTDMVIDSLGVCLAYALQKKIFVSGREKGARVGWRNEEIRQNSGGARHP